MSVALYERGLRTGAPVLARYADGSVRELDVDRWRGPARGADASLLDRLTDGVLDIGCGPGRLLGALAERGLTGLGIDISRVAVDLATNAGGRAVLCSVFDTVPGTGSWEWALLVDGNIGIGGDPVRLLRRIGELLVPAGRLLVEFGPPSSATRTTRIRLEDRQGTVGPWFHWADVAVDAADDLAEASGMQVLDRWSSPDPPVPGRTRWFAVLGTPCEQPTSRSPSCRRQGW